MRKKINNDKILNHKHFGLNDDSVSATGTTGLIPSAPESEAEYDSYKEIEKYQQNPITEK